MEKMELNDNDLYLLKELNTFRLMSDSDKLMTVTYEVETIKRCLNIVHNSMSSEKNFTNIDDIKGAISVITESVELLLSKLKQSNVK